MTSVTKRARGRRDERKSVAARYDAAGMGRRIARWNPRSLGPAKVIEGLQKIRDRARDATRNDWAAASTVQKWATNLVGVGITPRWKSKKLNDLWKAHVKTADADGVLDVYGLQTLGVRTWFDGGEAFMRRRPRSTALPLGAPVQYQLIEGEYCPLFDSDSWPGMPEGNIIRQGVEFNSYGRRVAYWFYREHPNDALRGNVDMSKLVRVLASDVTHFFEPKRPGQIRGVSELASILVRLRSTADFEDAVLERQKLANLFVAFTTRALPPDTDIEFDPDTGLPKFYDTNEQPLRSLEPGIMQELQPGESVTFANPPEAGTTFSDYLRTTNGGTAAGAGLPYELMSGDILNVSDRTLRVLIQEFRRFARQRQWQLVIPMLCQPGVDWWADALFLTGTITAAEYEEAKNPTWSPEGWEYIHPVQDAQGKQIEVDAGFRSRSSVILERGDDPEQVDQERADDQQREDDLDIAPTLPAAGGGAQPGNEPDDPAAKPSPARQKGKTKAQLEWEQRAIDRHRAGAEALEAQHREALSAQAASNATVLAMFERLMSQQAERDEKRRAEDIAARAAQATADREERERANAQISQALTAIAGIAGQLAAMKHEVNLHVEPAQINNEITTPAPIVNVTNEVDVPATEVHVAAPNVSITNEVQPAEVSVDVNLPDRQTTSVIDRDRDGNIQQVTQTETTLQ